LILDAGGSVACRIAGYARDDGSGGLHDHLYIDGGLTPSDVAHAWEIVKKSRDLGAWSPRVRSPMRCVSGIGHSSQCLLTRFSVMANFLVKKSIASGASTGGRGPARNKPGRPVDFEDVVELLLKVNASSTRQCRAPSTAAR